MRKETNPRVLLTVLAVLLTFSALPSAANPSGPAPQYQVWVCRGTLGGSTTGQWAATQVSFPYASAAGIVGFHLNVQEVPGLSVSWSAPGSTTLQVLDWNLNPKERSVRAAFRYSTAGVYQATCTLTYACPAGTSTLNIPFQVFVLP